MFSINKLFLEKKSNKNLNILLLLSLVLVFISLFADSFDGDIRFWESWVRHLKDHGYRHFRANYPPVFIHWLWCVGKIYSTFDLYLTKDILLKFLVLTPSMVFHLLFIKGVWWYSLNSNMNEKSRIYIASLTALNPAIYMNGPIWGQVDIFPTIFVIIALFLSIERKAIILVPSLISIAILSKFQMIMFLPVFGALFFWDKKNMTKGIFIAIPIIVIILLPYIGNNLFGMINSAYIKTTSQYPYATMNAANLWLLLMGNMTPDNRLIFMKTQEATNGFGFIFTPKGFGMISFTVLSIWVLIKGAFSRNKDTIWGLATLMPIAFFVLLSSMHERYMFAAVPVSILWAAYNYKRFPVALAASLLCFINMNLVLSIGGKSIWILISLLTVFLFIYCFFIMLKPKVIKFFCDFIFSYESRCGVIIPILFLIIWVYLFANLCVKNKQITAKSKQEVAYNLDLEEDIEYNKKFSLKEEINTEKVIEKFKEFLDGSIRAENSFNLEIHPLTRENITQGKFNKIIYTSQQGEIGEFRRKPVGIPFKNLELIIIDPIINLEKLWQGELVPYKIKKLEINNFILDAVEINQALSKFKDDTNKLRLDFKEKRLIVKWQGKPQVVLEIELQVASDIRVKTSDNIWFKLKKISIGKISLPGWLFQWLLEEYNPLIRLYKISGDLKIGKIILSQGKMKIGLNTEE